MAGAVAVLLSTGRFTPRQAVDRILGTAKDVGPAGRDATFGAGRLDLAAAVADLAPKPAPRPATAPAPKPARATTTTTSTTMPATPTTLAVAVPSTTTTTELEVGPAPQVEVQGAEARVAAADDVSPWAVPAALLLALVTAALVVTWRRQA